MSLIPIAQSHVFQKHLDSKVSRFLSFHIRRVDVHYIVAFGGELVNGSNGLNEP